MSVTSRKIMDVVGIKNVKTLTRWYQQGLIPRPTLEKNEDGGGRISCWPSWVLEHCKKIKELISQGKQLEEIAKTFGSNWTAIASRYDPRRYRFSDVTKKMDFDEKRNAVMEVIRTAILENLHATHQRMLTKEFLDKEVDIFNHAIDLSGEGYNPVLLVFADKPALVVPDFLVSAYLANNYASHEQFSVVPLFGIIAEHFGATDRPKVRPAQVLEREVDGQTVQESYALKGYWVIARAPRKKKKNRK